MKDLLRQLEALLEDRVTGIERLRSELEKTKKAIEDVSNIEGLDIEIKAIILTYLERRESVLKYKIDFDMVEIELTINDIENVRRFNK